eukprot:TRINITY_DN6975_c0_g1_i1.p1 TRINITY_DN6975_c0_g1~~TRINITY_DN6975_c0_g1_i1.p1  ORF type:complete len:512 (+),score=108.38 TRINITY_DN6975_c0_g1_i1:139-1536(+)
MYEAPDSPPSKAYFDLKSTHADHIARFSQMIFSDDPNLWFEGTFGFRKLLSVPNNPPIQSVIEANCVPRFVQFLRVDQIPSLQFESAWALTNIASGTSMQTQLVASYGTIEIFVQLLRSQNGELKDQAMWALGNLSGDSILLRDQILNTDIIDIICQIMDSRPKITIQKNIVWTISNLTRGKPTPDFQKLKRLIPYLARSIHAQDREIIMDALWCFSYLTDADEDQIQIVLEAGITQRLLELLSDQYFQAPCIRIIGNILTGNDQQTQHLIDQRVLPKLYLLLATPKSRIVLKETCWAICNITAGNLSQVQAVIDHNIIPQFISILQKSDFEVKKEVIYAFSNAIYKRNPSQIEHLVQSGILREFAVLLKLEDVELIKTMLKGVLIIFQVGRMQNYYPSIFEQYEGIDRLEELQEHKNNDIYKLSVKILEDFYDAAEEEQIHIAQDLTYGFGIPQSTVVPPFYFG